MASVPHNTRQLRACLVCSLVKNTEQFRKEGCENCEPFLQFKRHPERVQECTSTNFDGLIALMKPDDSWVARYKKIENYACGIYAVGVQGRIPELVEDEMAQRNIPYIPRDGSQNLPQN
ncbi:transcription initiation factor Spt4 [Gigaspora rosea]|uniref:Transcription elongation factor SPT4 n=2 Tax=Gigaspora TaxID=4873 RepID=A0A397W409_9GLOM|nr:transcription initiation Spt4 [Gigaspora margarita]RIB28762.1 transcription initiation factor Spt4 [Gigaspora rosea]